MDPATVKLILAAGDVAAVCLFGLFAGLVHPAFWKLLGVLAVLLALADLFRLLFLTRSDRT